MNDADEMEFSELDEAERAGKVLTGAERGRLADLRRKEILEAVARMIAQANAPTVPGLETR